MNLQTIKRWSKLYKHKHYTALFIALIIALLIIVICACIGFFTCDRELFVDPEEIKAQSAAVPIPPNKVCELPADPGFVCRNFAACCLPNSPNCICQSPNTQKCQQKYKDCLAGKLFSKESMNFLGNDNLAQICQKFADGCCSSSANNSDSQKVTPRPGMKPDLGNSTNRICQIDGYKKSNLAEFCGQLCNELPGCNYYQTDDVIGGCTVFKGQPIQAEKAAASSPVGNFKLFMRGGGIKTGKEGFWDDSTPVTGPAAQFCLSGAVNKCKPGNIPNPSQDCLCSHIVINDCQRMNSECINSGISQTVCKSQFGACCGLIDTNDPSKQATMAGISKPGGGQPNNLICRAPASKTLDECKRACLNHNKCKFIDTDLLPGGKSTNTYCDLYTGQPNGPKKVLLSKSDVGNTIYMKQQGSPDELEANAALEKK